MPKRSVAVALVGICTFIFSSNASLSSEYTKFRGIAINQTFHEAISSSGFVLQRNALDEQFCSGNCVDGNLYGIFVSGKACGSATILNWRVKNLSFSPCYFNAENLSPKRYIQTFIDSYNLGDMTEEWDPKLKRDVMRTVTKSGEIVTIILVDPPSIRVEISPSSPQFN